MTTTEFDRLRTSAKWINEVLLKLFPESCAFCVKIISASAVDLPEEEQITLKTAVGSRVQEFAAGRSAAREALLKLGLSRAIIPVSKDRSPIWPLGYVGSITHAAGIAVAVVAQVQNIKAIGIDMEKMSSVTSALWPEIMVAAEIDFLTSLPEYDRSCYATVIFSVKEAFYKFQHPHTKQWMEFRDLSVILDLEQQSCLLTATVPIKIGDSEPAIFSGLFRIGSSVVLTAVFC